MATEVASPLLTPPETVQAEQKRLPAFCALNSRSSTEGSTEGAGRICVLSELAFTTGYHSRYQSRGGTKRTWCYSLSPIICLVKVHRELLFPFTGYKPYTGTIRAVIAFHRSSLISQVEVPVQSVRGAIPFQSRGQY